MIDDNSLICSHCHESTIGQVWFEKVDLGLVINGRKLCESCASLLARMAGIGEPLTAEEERDVAEGLVPKTFNTSPQDLHRDLFDAEQLFLKSTGRTK